MKKTNRELYKLYYCMRESVEQNLAYTATVAWCLETIELDTKRYLVTVADDFDGVVPFLRISKDALVILDAMLIDSDDELFGMLKDYIEASADNYNEISKRVIGK